MNEPSTIHEAIAQEADKIVRTEEWLALNRSGRRRNAYTNSDRATDRVKLASFRQSLAELGGGQRDIEAAKRRARRAAA